MSAFLAEGALVLVADLEILAIVLVLCATILLVCGAVCLAANLKEKSDKRPHSD